MKHPTTLRQLEAFATAGPRVLLVSLIGVLSFSCVAIAQTPAPRMEDRLSDPVYLAWVSEPSVGRCVTCHFEGPGLAAVASGNVGSLTAFSRREEMDAWVSHDKHTIARQRVEPFSQRAQESVLLDLMESVDRRAKEATDFYRQKGIELDEDMIGLRKVPREWIGESNVLSLRICEKMWGVGSVESKQSEGYRNFEKSCLGCHGGVTSASLAFENANPEARKTALTGSAIGIDCLYCHQNSPEAVLWQEQHYQTSSWRVSPPEVKSAAGMTDLPNTATQAKLCMDCHVGNVKKGLFVTHEMYAAGHPPLPSVEVETFCQQMPQHWQRPGDLHARLEGDPTREAYFQINYPDVADEPAGYGKILWETRQMLIGVLTARRHAVQLMVDTAADDTTHFGDYAMYDCGSCHHELRPNSTRQQRYEGAVSLVGARMRLTPGRPRPHEWSQTILNAAYASAGLDFKQAASNAELRFAETFERTPFGDRSAIKKSGSNLLAVLDPAIKSISERTIDSNLARSVIKALCAVSPDRLLSYDSARQLAWAIQVVPTTWIAMKTRYPSRFGWRSSN